MCCKCKVEMDEVDDIAIKYGTMELPEAEGIRCPTCGREYLISDYVTGELNNAEAMLEGK
jgi:DNA-directed RNA polymerase subunit RPC12/RpoP